MGTWGIGISQNDTAADVYADYMELFNAQKEAGAILAEVKKRHADALEDEDDGPVAWLAIAKAQWECGHLSSDVLKRIERIVSHGEGLALWEESGTKSLERRRKLLDAFLAKLRTTNDRPRKPRRPTIRKPIFQTGDCLAVRLSDGDYGAAIVLGCPVEKVRPGGETYGLNLVGVLRYKSSLKPVPDVFKKREWLRLTYGHWNGKLDVTNVCALGFRKFKDRFEVVCQTPIREDDPKEADSYSAWTFAENVRHQARFEQ